MDITDQHPANDEPLKGLRCDCCKTWVANTDLQTMFELAEFVRIRIHSGYGARRFNDGDIREIDLCEDCAFELLSPHARKVASEDDQPRVVTPHTPES